MKLLVIIASTRPGRIGKPIGDWFVEQARAHGDFDVEVADLGQIGLPLFDEPAHPMLRQYAHQHTRDWSALVDSADAVVFVMPEYNHSFNAALKNAIDYLHHEWAYKPVAFVSYGGVSGGLRAVQAIKPVVAPLRMTVVSEAVVIPMVRTMLDDTGFHPTPLVADSVVPMLNELTKLAAAFIPVREVQRAAA